MPKIFARHRTGFRIELDDISRDKLEAAIEWLIEHGFQSDISGDQWQRTPSGEPLCPRHGTAMSKRERQGDSWWSHRVVHPETAEELYCRGYPNPSSRADGYGV